MGMGPTCNEAVIGGLGDCSEELNDVSMAQRTKYLSLGGGGKDYCLFNIRRVGVCIITEPKLQGFIHTRLQS